MFKCFKLLFFSVLVFFTALVLKWD